MHFRFSILAAAFFSLAAAAGAAQQVQDESLPAITVSRVETRTLAARVLGSGFVSPVERVQVQPQIEGQAIESIAADLGDTVEAGQVLARLSQSALDLALNQAKAQISSAEAAIAQARAQLVQAEATRRDALRTKQRTDELARRGAATQAAADSADAKFQAADAAVKAAQQGLIAAQAQRRVAESQVEDVQLKLQRTRITAPVAGLVIEKNAMVGAIASAAGAPMFTLVRDGKLELVADVAEEDTIRLEQGQAARIYVEGRAQPISGKVRMVEPVIDRETRLGKVHVSIEEPATVRAGMFAEVSVIVARREALAVPVSAIGGDDATTTVMKVVDGTARNVAVETGIRENGIVEVTSGLSPGDLVVTKAGAFVRDGDRINPVMAATAPPAVSN